MLLCFLYLLDLIETAAGTSTELKSVSNCNVVGNWFGSSDNCFGFVTTEPGGGVNGP